MTRGSYKDRATRTFRVGLRGENFLVELDGKIRKVGFFATRTVSALDKAAAELAAVDLIRGDDSLLSIVRNSIEESPRIFAESIEELADADPGSPKTGYTFFAE